jgi:CheY-like chemotaxis protein
MVCSGQVGPADRSRKQCVPDEQILSRLPGGSYLQADAPRAMPWGVMRTHLEVSKWDHLPWRVELVDRRRRWIDRDSEHEPLLHRLLVQKQIVTVQVHGRVQVALGPTDPCDMVHMGVREQNVTEPQRLLDAEGEQAVDLVARIDQHTFTRARTGHDEAVLEEGTDGPGLDYHHGVILAIVDDLMFTSKIKAAANQLGVTVAFARSSAAALTGMRANPPALVILDLNSARTDPLGTVEAMKAEPALAAIPTVGFVSHVQTDVIQAARHAGVDEVLARSAFTERLPDILTRAK